MDFVQHVSEFTALQRCRRRRLLLIRVRTRMRFFVLARSKPYMATHTHNTQVRASTRRRTRATCQSAAV